jgi:phage-related holin
MFQEVYFCTVLYDFNFYVLYEEITIIKNSSTINLLEHKEHRNYNYIEQYNNKLPGT